MSQTNVVVPEAVQTESRASRMVRDVFESGRPLLYIRSTEEQRVGRVLREAGSHMRAQEAVPVWTWTLTEGLRDQNGQIQTGTESPRLALDFIAAWPSAGIFHLEDFHEALRDSAEVRRRTRDLYALSRGTRKFVVITSPVQAIPQELDRTIAYLELRPPDVTELVDFLTEQLADSSGPHARTGQDRDLLTQYARALQGLTLDEVEFALQRATRQNPDPGPEAIPALLEEKRLLVNRTGVIEFISANTRMTEVGGLDLLKKWLLERQKLFQLRDSLTAELVPKGMLIMGIPGCGKSLCVKAIASYFALPLYRVDMIEIFSGRHGKPEAAFVQACRMLEDVAPAVLWFDEIEMGITSSESGGEQGRIFAFFLTWMQEKSRGLFVAATANRIDLLPAEMLRKGRFDEVFFVDLPTDDERVEIFRIHLERRGVEAGRFDLDQLRQFTIGWTGAEVEQCVVSALTRARLADRELGNQDLVSTAVTIVPLSRTMSEQINHIRSWAFERAVRATPRQTGR